MRAHVAKSNGTCEHENGQANTDIKSTVLGRACICTLSDSATIQTLISAHLSLVHMYVHHSTFVHPPNAENARNILDSDNMLTFF